MTPDLGAAANPEWAAKALRRLTDTAPEHVQRLLDDPGVAHRFAVVTGASLALGELLGALPALLDVFEAPPEAWTDTDVADVASQRIAAAIALDSAPRAQQVAELLATTQREGLLRVATRDMLGLADTQMAAAELADLADGLIQTALSVVGAREPAAQVAVLGMGKLGGQELNYVSDIDVLFVHEGDVTAAERTAKGVMYLLGTHTPRGACYEMDANLRPEGRNGPLSRTLASYEAYYGTWAKTWEFQALLKARPIAGPSELGEGFSELVIPFVWPEARGAEAVEEIQRMKARVEQSRPVVKDGERQLKLAPGGLRDIEFATQLLQLVHGPADPSLRERGTVPALAALAAGGYVDEGDAALFTDAYLFLRTVEHRLQLRQLRRTHTVPEHGEDIQRLARAMGFRDLPVRTAAEEFTTEMARVRAGVRRLHQQFFYRPLLSTIASYGPDERMGSRGLDREAVESRLRALGFGAPSRAWGHLEAMTKGSDRTARQLRVVLPAMLEALSDTPDPDGGLHQLRLLVDALRTNPRFNRTIRDNPPAARLLARLLGRGPRVGRWFSRQPEMLELLEDTEGLAEPRDHELMTSSARGLVRRGGGRVSTDALRRFKRREALRVALRDLSDVADVAQIGLELTWLGEALLDAALTTVGGEDSGAGGTRIAVIGMGRFGARELAHASDLDVVFVHEGDTPRALKVASDVLAHLDKVTPEGSAFRIDPDLRPEGRKGPLTRTLDSFEQYYLRWGASWEFQALTQARPVAGDPDLGQAFMDLVTPLVYRNPQPPEQIVEIRRMKARVERERAGRRGIQPAHRPRHGPRMGAHGASRTGLPPSPAPGEGDLKLGPGGLSDVEWTVQLLLLLHGGGQPDIIGPGTLDGLRRLAKAELLSTEEAGWLQAGWELLSQVRNRLYLIGERDTSTLPQDPDVLARLAASMHRDGGQALTEEVDRARRRIRKVFDRRFFGVTRPTANAVSLVGRQRQDQRCRRQLQVWSYGRDRRNHHHRGQPRGGRGVLHRDGRP